MAGGQAVTQGHDLSPFITDSGTLVRKDGFLYCLFPGPERIGEAPVFIPVGITVVDRVIHRAVHEQVAVHGLPAAASLAAARLNDLPIPGGRRRTDLVG